MTYSDLIAWIVIYYNTGISDNFAHLVTVTFSLVCGPFFPRATIDLVDLNAIADVYMIRYEGIKEKNIYP